MPTPTVIHASDFNQPRLSNTGHIHSFAPAMPQQTTQPNLQRLANATALVQTAQTMTIIAVKLGRTASSHAIEAHERYSSIPIRFTSAESKEEDV